MTPWITVAGNCRFVVHLTILKPGNNVSANAHSEQPGSGSVLHREVIVLVNAQYVTVTCLYRLNFREELCTILPIL